MVAYLSAGTATKLHTLLTHLNTVQCPVVGSLRERKAALRLHASFPLMAVCLVLSSQMIRRWLTSVSGVCVTADAMIPTLEQWAVPTVRA